MTTNPNKSRIQTIDLLRGIIMIIMALDHTRDFFHAPALTDDPLNLATTTPILFFTRWITHLCAPTFVFLSGVSAWLQGQRKSKKELSGFLITRGLWLILLDLIVITLGTTADIHFGVFIIQTLWAIGISMSILGVMIWLPYPAILALGLLIVLGHNSIDFAEAKHVGDFPVWWIVLHKQGFIPLWSDHGIFVFYPFLSWAGLMMLGYCCGKIFTSYEGKLRQGILLRLGIGLLLFFAVLRFTNLYGDSQHWSQQKNMVYTFLSFMNVQKYPPSLLYMCATIGISLIFLGLVSRTDSRFAKVLIVYGRVPMFYYILHFYLLTAISITKFFITGHTLAEGMKGADGMPWKFVAPGEGYRLFIVYLIWLGVVTALYPVCKRYDRYKTAHPEKKWLSYL